MQKPTSLRKQAINPELQMQLRNSSNYRSRG